MPLLLKGSSFDKGRPSLSSHEQGLETKGLLRVPCPAAHNRGKPCCQIMGPPTPQPDTAHLLWVDNVCLSGLAVQWVGPDHLSLFPLSSSFLSDANSLSQSLSIWPSGTNYLAVCFCLSLCVSVCVFFSGGLELGELGENVIYVIPLSPDEIIWFSSSSHMFCLSFIYSFSSRLLRAFCGPDTLLSRIFCHQRHSAISLELSYTHLVSGAEGKKEKQILITCALNVMLGSHGEKYHISNVNIKLHDTLSINNAHLKRGGKLC